MEKSNCTPKKQQQEGSWRGSYMRNNSQLQVIWQWRILELTVSESELSAQSWRRIFKLDRPLWYPADSG